MSRIFTAGKYDGMDMYEVADLDPSYVLWAIDTPECKDVVPAGAVTRAIRNLDRCDDFAYDPLSELGIDFQQERDYDYA